MKEIILIGGGGHCRSCIDVIESAGEFKIAGIIDVKDKIGTKICGYEVIGEDADLPELFKKYKNVLITVGQIKSSKVRLKVYEELKAMGFGFPVIVAATAQVSNHSELGEGTIVMHHAVVNANVKVGVNCILNSKSLIEHDCQIGDYCHISTAAVINGTVSIGNRNFIGSNATIIQSIITADDVTVGINSLVLNDITEPGVFVGNPIRKID
jgi:sugar O-acyltransferase (sialic acid O-acetyltransferase NeuD family)